MKKQFLILSLSASILSAVVPDIRTQAGNLANVKRADMCNYTKGHTYETLFNEAVTETLPDQELQHVICIANSIFSGDLDTLSIKQYFAFSVALAQVRQKYMLKAGQVILQQREALYSPQYLFSLDLNSAIGIVMQKARETNQKSSIHHFIRWSFYG